MSYKKFLGAASAALMVIVLTLVLAPAARAASQYKVLHTFNYSDGANPQGDLIFDASGNIYGTTQNGGGHAPGGTAFKLTPKADGSWKESVVRSFNGSDGGGPLAGLIFDAAGNLYGTTYEGGARGYSTAFKLTPKADGRWTESLLHSFNGSDGEYPYSGLIFDAAGNLYGATSNGGHGSNICAGTGCGVVFRLTPNADGGWTESVLHYFNGGDGGNPQGSLIFDAAGNLYGTTSFGGAHGTGAVFKLTPNADGTWTESVLHSFNGSDGEFPSSGLIFDATGNLYGTTVGGGDETCATGGCGVVFKLTPNADGTWTENVLHRFRGKPAESPLAGLIFDATGNLYGTAIHSGSENGGAVFKLSPNQNGSWAYSLLHVFQGKPALDPFGGLVLGSAGSLYGTTITCGNNRCAGLVYQITP